MRKNSVLKNHVLPLTAAALVLSGLSLGGAAAQATDEARAAEPSLSEPAHGQRAIRELGDQLDEAAALNGWTAAQLRTALATDPTAWVDRRGRVFYKDPAAPAHASSEPQVATAAPFPLPDTFLLHSKPGSDLTLLLDFDGTDVSGTAWNANFGVPSGAAPAWSLDGDPATFNDAEREAIQTVWQRVAEDYAAFDIDVTTQDPGLAGIERANLADSVYGTRALVTPHNAAQTAICGGPTCGGVAYINVFGEVGSYHQPAYVFPQSLGDDAKNIAEAVSHEVGHNFSLQHDGTTVAQGAPCAGATTYYCGHAMWAPIMGVGYYKPVSQWSKGEYANANNTVQDDLALIAARAPYRADDAGDTLATASTATTGTKHISTALDKDVFLLGTCTGAVTVTAATPSPANPSPDLDIRLDLMNSLGTVVATDNPASVMVDRETATGLSASVSASGTGGSYYARVDGVGNGSGATGYTDYASLGAYALTIAGCTPAAGPPAAPGSVVATGNSATRTAQVSWTAPSNIGGGAITGYTVLLNGSPATTTTTPGATLTGLALGTAYTVSVRANNAVGSGPAASAQSFTLVDRPEAPAIGKAKKGKKGGKKTVKVSWSAPTSTGGLPLTGYRVVIMKKNGKVIKTVDRPAAKTKYTAKFKRGGKYRFAVIAVNAVGDSPQSATSKAVKAR